MFTVYNWIFFSILIFVTLMAVVTSIAESSPGGAIVSLIIGILITGGCMGYTAWHHTSTASGIRYMKDYRSELENGIDREITITAEDGREIFHYEGKVDIESNHEDNYIKFESEDGKRYIIYYGIQDTIEIIEK